MHFELNPQQVELRDAARKLAQEVFKDKAAHWDREEIFPEENKKLLCELGYTGLSVDPQYGGAGLGLVDTYLVIEEIAKVDLATALIVHEQNVSPRIIATYGPEAMRAKLVPKFVSGELECSIAWTEPQAGSDAASVTTTAVREGDEYVINGQKVFTTYGDRAHLHLVYARLALPRRARRGHDLGAQGQPGPHGAQAPLQRWACAARARTSSFRQRACAGRERGHAGRSAKFQGLRRAADGL